MEKYRKKLKILAGIGFLVVVLLIVILFLNKEIFMEDTHQSGFRLGMCVGIIGIALIIVVNNILSLRNKDRLRKQYIKENDEREMIIQYKAMRVGMQYIAYSSLIMIFIAAFYQDKETLEIIYGYILSIAIVKVCAKFYFQRKL